MLLGEKSRLGCVSPSPKSRTLADIYRPTRVYVMRILLPSAGLIRKVTVSPIHNSVMDAAIDCTAPPPHPSVGRRTAVPRTRQWVCWETRQSGREIGHRLGKKEIWAFLVSKSHSFPPAGARRALGRETAQNSATFGNPTRVEFRLVIMNCDSVGFRHQFAHESLGISELSMSRWGLHSAGVVKIRALYDHVDDASTSHL